MRLRISFLVNSYKCVALLQGLRKMWCVEMLVSLMYGFKDCFLFLFFSLVQSSWSEENPMFHISVLGTIGHQS